MSAGLFTSNALKMPVSAGHPWNPRRAPHICTLSSNALWGLVLICSMAKKHDTAHNQNARAVLLMPDVPTNRLRPTESLRK